MNRSSILFLILLGIFCLPLILATSLSYPENPITPNDEFFTLSIGAIPVIDPSSWMLKVDGHVDNPLTFTYENFTNQPTREVIATLQCVEGPSGTAKWRGVPLKELLQAVQLRSGAVDVVFYAADNFSSSLTIAEASADDVLLAFEMNEEPLPEEHGFPVRVVAPNHAGYKWVKWVEHIEIVDYDYRGFWETVGWSDDAKFTTTSDWRLHAILLSISFLFGGLSLMAGFKFSSTNDFFRDLPNFISRKFHLFVSTLYVLSSILVFIFWVNQTILLRGGVFYTWHGVIGLITVVSVVAAGVTGILKYRRGSRKQEQDWHGVITLLSIIFYVMVIILGFSRAFGYGYGFGV
ncbi:MAG: molybdopterin-dependent oxidoreductase [Candidatus Hermodarchaeota archaeon]